MKKVLISMAFAVIMTSAVAQAAVSAIVGTAGKYGSAGCGLGSMIFEDQPGPVQIVAATTNGTLGNQTFGMTSGTSNCPSALKTANNERLNEFVVSNLDRLAKEIAIGQGESLDTLAELLGISVEKRAEVYVRLQSNFSKIFSVEQIQAAEVIDNIVKVING
jgi:hypothetical protein